LCIAMKDGRRKPRYGRAELRLPSRCEEKAAEQAYAS
jgi:hypothetical protein